MNCVEIMAIALLIEIEVKDIYKVTILWNFSVVWAESASWSVPRMCNSSESIKKWDVSLLNNFVKTFFF